MPNSAVHTVPTVLCAQCSADEGLVPVEIRHDYSEGHVEDKGENEDEDEDRGEGG